MTELRKLNVSLTKHGAHKVSTLLEKYEIDEVLKHLSGSEPGINIEQAQAKKTLSVDESGAVPLLWNEAKKRGSETLNALVLIGIIFSHHQLIAAMKGSSGKRKFSGKIVRGTHIDGKAYTNFAHIIEELGYSVEHSPDHVEYDLHKLFHIRGLNELAVDLLGLKLESAGWDKKNTFFEESGRLEFNNVFSVTPAEFQSWLLSGVLNEKGDATQLPKDLEFFLRATDRRSSSPFVFESGHKRKKTGTVNVKPSKNETVATLLHNEIQNSLIDKLIAIYGKDCVRSECPSGDGTLIDIVVKTSSFCWFYEIKTADSVRGCIRQALPQLLEYAFWHGKGDRANRLIIVSPLPVTKEGEKYLKFLRDTFKLELYYEQHQATTGTQ